MLRKERFYDIVSIIYDQLAPKIAFYPSKKEIEEWITKTGGELLELSRRTNNSWRVHLALVTEKNKDIL